MMEMRKVFGRAIKWWQRALVTPLVLAISLYFIADELRHPSGMTFVFVAFDLFLGWFAISVAVMPTEDGPNKQYWFKQAVISATCATVTIVGGSLYAVLKS
jgi:hypothetical protein